MHDCRKRRWLRCTCAPCCVAAHYTLWVPLAPPATMVALPPYAGAGAAALWHAIHQSVCTGERFCCSLVWQQTAYMQPQAALEHKRGCKMTAVVRACTAWPLRWEALALSAAWLHGLLCPAAAGRPLVCGRAAAEPHACAMRVLNLDLHCCFNRCRTHLFVRKASCRSACLRHAFSEPRLALIFNWCVCFWCRTPPSLWRSCRSACCPAW